MGATFAAIASAVAAIGSAIAAVYALLFLAHQEEISKAQLQAMYFSNLYSKQVDQLAIAYSSFDDLRLSAQFGLFTRQGMERLGLSDVERIRSILFTDKDADQIRTIIHQLEATKLALPPSATKEIDYGIALLLEFLVEAAKFQNGSHTEPALQNFYDKETKNINDLIKWQMTFFDCAHNIFARGHSIDDDEFKKCSLNSDPDALFKELAKIRLQ